MSAFAKRGVLRKARHVCWNRKRSRIVNLCKIVAFFKKPGGVHSKTNALGTCIRNLRCQRRSLQRRQRTDRFARLHEVVGMNIEVREGLLNLHDAFLNAALAGRANWKAPIDEDPENFHISDHGRFERMWVTFLYVLVEA
jgi:hypothetical protein